MTDTELREHEARAAAATPGPWGYRAERQSTKTRFVFPAEVFAIDGTAYGAPVGSTTADAAFIAAARAAVPALCAALREAWQTRDAAIAMGQTLGGRLAQVALVLGARGDETALDRAKAVADAHDAAIARAERAERSLALARLPVGDVDGALVALGVEP